MAVAAMRTGRRAPVSYGRVCSEAKISSQRGMWPWNRPQAAEYTIAQAKALGHTLELASNSKLANAVHLYDLRFRHLPPSGWSCLPCSCERLYGVAPVASKVDQA
jgi:hypothetical protein